MLKNFFDKMSHLQLVLLLIVISYFFLMFGNGIISLTHPDEVFYIQSAREMLHHQSWMTPMIFDHPQFEKPILSFILFVAAIKWFGLTPFVARFWPAFFGILGVGVTYWMAWMLFQKKRVAFLSGIILASCFIYLALSRAVLTDMIFSILVVITIGFFGFAYLFREHKNLGIILFFVFSGIAVMTKGILGFTFPVGAALIFLVYKKDLGFLKSGSVLWGLGLFALIAVPWHVLMFQMYGQTFLEEYFGNVHMRRLFVAEHPKLDNWYFYFGLMFAGVLPWSLFWIPTGNEIYKAFKTDRQTFDKIFFILAWLISTYIFVQPAHSKLSSYIFPVFPGIAILLGYTLDAIIDRTSQGQESKLLRICGYGISLIAVGAAIAAILFAKQHMDIIVNIKPIYLFSALMVLVGIGIFILNQRRQYVKMIFAHTGITITLLITLFFAKPYIEPWVSCQDVCRLFKKIDQSSTTVLSSKFYVRAVRYYTDREMAVIDINGKGFFSPHPIPFLNTDEKVVDFLNTQETTYAIVKEGNVEDLKRIAQKYKFRITELGGEAGKYILKIDRI